MKKIKKYIVLILAVITAIFALPLIACDNEDYDKDVVGVDGFTREQVIEIRHAYIKSFQKNQKSKLQYLNVRGNFGTYDGNMVAIVKYDDPHNIAPAIIGPLYVNDIYIASLNCSDNIVVVSNGECMHIQSAYEAGIITDEHLSQIIEISKAKELYDESVNDPPPWLQG